jgi:hypothetical protein
MGVIIYENGRMQRQRDLRPSEELESSAFERVFFFLARICHVYLRIHNNERLYLEIGSCL